MNSDVHRHQAHPPLAQHSVGPCGWYSASATPAPTAPARLKRTQPPHQLPSGGGVSSNGPHAPVSPTALQNSVPHNNVMPSSARAPAPAGPAPSMHTSQTASGGAKGPSDLLVNSACVNPPPPANRLINMTQFPWHHGAISRERAEALLSSSPDGVFLVRESTNFPGDHTLCVRFRGRVEHYRVKWATAPDSQTQRLTIDDEEFFDTMNDLIKHYLQDADGLCTKLVRYLPKAAPNGANNGALQPPYPPHPQQPPPYPPTPHVPALALAGFQPTYSQQLPPAPAAPAPAPAHDQVDATNFLEARESRPPAACCLLPHVPALALAGFQPTYSQQLPPAPAAPAPAPAHDQVDATNFLEARESRPPAACCLLPHVPALALAGFQPTYSQQLPPAPAAPAPAPAHDQVDATNFLEARESRPPAACCLLPHVPALALAGFQPTYSQQLPPAPAAPAPAPAHDQVDATNFLEARESRPPAACCLLPHVPALALAGFQPTYSQQLPPAPAAPAPAPAHDQVDATNFLEARESRPPAACCLLPHVPALALAGFQPTYSQQLPPAPAAPAPAPAHDQVDATNFLEARESRPPAACCLLPHVPALALAGFQPTYSQQLPPAPAAPAPAPAHDQVDATNFLEARESRPPAACCLLPHVPALALAGFQPTYSQQLPPAPAAPAPAPAHDQVDATNFLEARESRPPAACCLLPHVPALALAGFQPTYSQQLPPAPAAPAPAPAHDQVDATNFLEARWVINERDLEIRENIGKGEFGDVMLGILNGNLKVAVKILKDREAASKFRAEATVMASLKHENLVRLLGLVFSASGTCLVTEHCAQGSLLDYLRSRGRHYVTQLNQINFAYDACCGMEYLERSRVVHRDLAARNVLISGEGTAKVADFGLARAELAPDDPADALRVQAKLPIKWTAPEALKYNKFSNKSDMWSFGILLWEIYSFGRVPYPRIPLAEVVRHVERGYRMEAPEGCGAGPYDVMRAAWHADPAQRPTFQQTRRTLAAIRDLAHAQPQPAPPVPPHP